jgi:hypothetical protein
MVWLAGLLGVLEFLEFLTTPMGLAVSLGLSVYLFGLQTLELSFEIAAVSSGLVASNFYFVLQQFED